MIKKKKGFTLIELLIVMGIIGVLATLGIANYRTSKRRAFDAERKSDLKQYQNKLGEYAVDHLGLYPKQATAVTICDIATELGVSPCFNDYRSAVNYLYYSADGTDYVLWADLEQCGPGVTDCYWVVCGDGRVGDTVTNPDDGVGNITCTAPN